MHRIVIAAGVGVFFTLPAIAPDLFWSSALGADRMKAAGQPLCIDQDALMTYLTAGMLAVQGKITKEDAAAAVTGCQSIPPGAQVDVLERYASGTEFMRICKVKVSSKTMRGPTVGYTVEIDQ